MSTTQHIRRSAAATLIIAATLVFATASGIAAPARQVTSGPYPWPVEPFDAPHPIRTRELLKDYDPGLCALVNETMAYDGHVDWRFTAAP